jgi:hypothetical protein
MMAAKLESALKTKAAMVIYHVEKTADVIASVEAAAKKTVKPVDGRGEQAGFQASLAEQTKAGGPVIVLLGATMSDGVRAALDACVEGGTKIVALTPAHAPTADMATLFPMQLAASAL